MIKETKTVKINKENHKRLKKEAVDIEMTVSDLLDLILEEHYANR